MRANEAFWHVGISGVPPASVIDRLQFATEIAIANDAYQAQRDDALEMGQKVLDRLAAADLTDEVGYKRLVNEWGGATHDERYSYDPARSRRLRMAFVAAFWSRIAKRIAGKSLGR